MPEKKPGFINVDQLAQQLSVEQILDYFGVPHEAVHRTGSEIRTKCFLQCGKHHDTGDRAIAIQSEHPAKLWQCHDYGCQKNGNVVSLISLALGGPARPRGADFRKAAQVMQAIAEGRSAAGVAAAATQGRAQDKDNQAADSRPDKANVALEDSDNERVRAVANLYEKLTLDISTMPPEVSRYTRRRHFLTEEIAKDWGVGYLSKDTDGNRSGGTMRGKFVVTVRNQDGQVVGYAGRDCAWERKHEAWVAAGREGKEPAKWIFPKNFHRGVEVYGQERMNEESVGPKLTETGLPVVEGALDAINLWTALDTPSVAVLSNHATQQQLERIADLAYQVAGGAALLLYDCDEGGEKGMDTDIVKLSKLCRVQRGWAKDMYGGAFADREPSELSVADWQTIKGRVSRGMAV